MILFSSYFRVYKTKINCVRNCLPIVRLSLLGYVDTDSFFFIPVLDGFSGDMEF